MHRLNPAEAASSVMRAAWRVVAMYWEKPIILTVFMLLIILDVRAARSWTHWFHFFCRLGRSLLITEVASVQASERAHQYQYQYV